MKYRSFTKDNLKVSQLGFGCMRFPILEEDSGKIDSKETEILLDYAIEHGVNYIDTAFPYHKENSEIFLGEYFKKTNKRKQIYLASKSPVWKAQKKGDFYKLLKLQLERLQTDYIDFYLLHALDQARWDKIIELDVFKDMERAKEEGLIRYLGFSFHDEYPVFEKICNGYHWDFLQIQLNYMDVDHQAGLKGLNYAYNKEISVVIMEPVKGGKLSHPPKDVEEIFAGAQHKLSYSGHALAYLWNLPQVSVVLSGMSSLEQVKDNIETAHIIGVDSLNLEDQKKYSRARDILNQGLKVACTACQYCMPCPSGVEIPNIFTLYNDLSMYGSTSSKEKYVTLMEKTQGADSCVSCGLCEEACPQHLTIRNHLSEAHMTLMEDK